MKIKFMSLNALHGGELMDNMVAFLKQESPDILFLQEMYDETDESLPPQYRAFSHLKSTLGYGYGNFSAVSRNETPIGVITEGNAILSKFPISNPGTTHFVESDGRDYYRERDEDWPVFPRALQHAEIQVDGATVNAVNVQGPWDLDGDNPGEMRQQMVKAIIEQVKGKSNVIVAGDTNAKPTNQAMIPLEEHLHNVFGNELKSTFNMRQKTNPGYSTAVVDLVYTSPDVKILSKQCPDVDVSDHLPLIVELEVA